MSHCYDCIYYNEEEYSCSLGYTPETCEEYEDEEER